MTTYRELFAHACKQGLAPHEAQLLLEQLSGLSQTGLLLHLDDPADAEQQAVFEQRVLRRLSGYPLQYLLGQWEFFGLPFLVGEGVLIPRADTEILVETALELCDGKLAPQLCDLCSGTGCIPISLSKNLPEDARLTAVELSEQALGYLRRNRDLHQCTNLQIVQADVLSWQPGCRFDLITANPPYIGADEMANLQPEVRQEPEMALLAPEDGLYFYRILSERCRRFLKEDGWLLFEIGYRQGSVVSQFLQENGFDQIRVIPDYGGNDRVVIGHLPRNQ